MGKKEHCPGCSNRCPKESLGCERGRRHFAKKNRTDEEGFIPGLLEEMKEDIPEEKDGRG